MLTQSQVSEIVTKYGSNANDTGTTEVQVALFTARINQLTEHLKQRPKDHASRRGLLRLVGRRRRFLKYLSSKDHDRYQNLIQSLNIRGLKS